MFNVMRSISLRFTCLLTSLWSRKLFSHLSRHRGVIVVRACCFRWEMSDPQLTSATAAISLPPGGQTMRDWTLRLTMFSVKLSLSHEPCSVARRWYVCTQHRTTSSVTCPSVICHAVSCCHGRVARACPVARDSAHARDVSTVRGHIAPAVIDRLPDN